MSILGGGGPGDDFDSNTVNGDTENDDNPCDYYFLNILFDTTIGIFILWGALYIVFALARKLKIEGVESGQYGNPPKYSWYFKQLGLYFVGLLTMKVALYVTLKLFPFLITFASWVLSWSDGIPNIQVFFVVLVFPLIMNTFQYYVIDNIIQSPEYHATNKHVQKLDESNPSIRGDVESVHGMLGQHEPLPDEMEGEICTTSTDDTTMNSTSK
ncbi:unnamed protein product [Ambrosiozyma monospora]|uniref:Unnamed protein product n=2 Tax=Ambrosiozyma monospora TaxID=43982 RepID=A0ACB5UD38_AMBMO|nr:unnamed protein product [Ambrosiozyma monospora]